MPFEVGHTINNGRQKPKLYADALKLEIRAAAEADNPLKALRKIARAHLKRAEQGDVQAIRELADRLDGKVPQATEITGDIEHRYVIEAPSLLTGSEWQARYQVGVEPVAALENLSDFNEERPLGEGDALALPKPDGA